jgi:hypothetical protein
MKTKQIFTKLEQGGGEVQRQDGVTRLWRPAVTRAGYANAQLDDYHTGLLHSAPARLDVEACFSHPLDHLIGTAGFGFWNAPFAPGSARLRLPKTAWFFFGSPPLNLPLAMDVPGDGLKVATLDATPPLFLLLLPTAPIGFLLMRHRGLYRRLWRIGQCAIKVSEAPVNIDITTCHRYTIDWHADAVHFSVDGKHIHSTPYSPKGKMGVVLWIDNQYAIATPQGQFGWGLQACDAPQWLDLHSLTLD